MIFFAFVDTLSAFIVLEQQNAKVPKWRRICNQEAGKKDKLAAKKIT
jgi:hypothetical protein